MANKTRREQFIVTISGTTGTAQTKRPIMGEFDSVHYAYSDSMASTCIVVLKRKSDGATPEEILLTVSNTNDDLWYRPIGEAVDKNSVALPTEHQKYHISGYVEAVVTQGTDTETVTVTIMYEASQ